MRNVAEWSPNMYLLRSPPQINHKSTINGPSSLERLYKSYNHINILCEKDPMLLMYLQHLTRNIHTKIFSKFFITPKTGNNPDILLGKLKTLKLPNLFKIQLISQAIRLKIETEIHSEFTLN